MEKQKSETVERLVERIDVVDENNVPTGFSMPRDRVHAEGLWHRTVHIYILRPTPQGYEVLVHTRSSKKKQYPGKLDPVFGGHIKSGQDTQAAAIAELGEETGLMPDVSRLRYHGFAKKDDPVNAQNDREFNMIFTYLITDEEAEAAVFDPEEIESVQWVPLSKVGRAIRENPVEWRTTSEEFGAGELIVKSGGFADN